MKIETRIKKLEEMLKIALNTISDMGECEDWACDYCIHKNKKRCGCCDTFEWDKAKKIKKLLGDDEDVI